MNENINSKLPKFSTQTLSVKRVLTLALKENFSKVYSNHFAFCSLWMSFVQHFSSLLVYKIPNNIPTLAGSAVFWSTKLSTQHWSLIGKMNLNLQPSPRITPNVYNLFVLLFCRIVVCSYCSVFVLWLGGSFAKHGYSLGLCGLAIVPPNDRLEFFI